MRIIAGLLILVAVQFVSAQVAARRNLVPVSFGDQECRLFNLGCSAVDIEPTPTPFVSCTQGCITTLGSSGRGLACTAGSNITVAITQSVQFSSGEDRFDVVYTSYHGSDRCTAEAANTSSPATPQITDLDADGCGDLILGQDRIVNYALNPITIPCEDADASGTVDWFVCIGYSGSGSTDCSSARDAVNNVQPSRCRCATINLPVDVVSCLTTGCPPWAAPGQTWSAGATAEDRCVAHTGMCTSDPNCHWRSDGYCLRDQGVTRDLACLYLYKVPGTVCRPAAGDCDVPETCSGYSSSCPMDLRHPPSTLCRPSAGCCDPAEYCDGGVECPYDARAPNTTVCLQTFGVSGDCGEVVYCDGGVNCPKKAVAE